jgi:tetratricopeptide (TPR) repeat protein
MGDSYIALDELGIALGCYSQAIMIDECYRDPYFSLGYCLNNLNEYEHTILILEKCLEKTKRYYSWLERDRA